MTTWVDVNLGATAWATQGDTTAFQCEAFQEDAFFMDCEDVTDWTATTPPATVWS